MATSDLASELEFEAPSAASWSIDAVHFPRPATLYWTEIHPAALRRGFSEFTAYYGMLIDMEMAYVNGFAYQSVQPVAPDQIPARFARAEEVWAGKLWRDQLREWDESFKPGSIRAHKELQAVDPTSLTDAELVAYLTRCRDHHAEMIYQHMRFTGAAMIALGDLLAHAGDWTGMPPADLLSMMRGAAPVSAGASGELSRMIAAFAADPVARALLFSGGDPGETLDQLRALDGEVGAAVSAYLELTGYRLLDGFDISGRYALEMPDVLLRAMRAALELSEEGRADFDVDARIAEVRERVPEEHVDEFDELLGEARLMYRIRDERGVFSDIWASGIMRRAVMAAGERLASRGQIHQAEHLIDAGFAEMTALLSDAGGPLADELAERHRWRTSHTAKEAPPHLGAPAQAPPDPSGLPPAVARVMRAAGITMMSMFAPSMEAHEGATMRGLAASGGIYEGPARRVAGPAEFDRIVKGDVLVTECTSEAFNILLPLLGAIVTDSGGVLSHPAIVAREYGIPGVVGTRNATELIADGARVRVDGDAGSVTVLE
ncbi:MAG TPA: PEP-utilizing enzyme [Solirubrobacteraceae bacterium]|nr:PEP-utilizing enzyme [Solirubrobacteraceae bacterium]